MRFRYTFLLATAFFVAELCHAATPQVTGTSPVSGSIGTVVQISGSGFGTTTGTVTFNGVTATTSSWADGQITATVPTATTGAVIVTAGGTQSNNNVYFTIPQPLVGSISPVSGVAGTAVTVTGSDFGPSQGSSGIRINGGPLLTVSSWSSTQIKATVPANTTTGPVVVTIGTVASNPDVIFTVPTPSITGITPSSGPVTTSVQVNGRGFGATQGSSTIKINGSALNVATWSDGQITATLPATITTGPVQVAVNGINSNSNLIFTVPPPQIISISPSAGVAGTSVTINGSGFQATRPAGANIYFNGIPATPSTWTDAKIVANAPSTSTGPVTVSLNSVTSNSDVVFKFPAPFISGLVPSSGPAGTQATVQVNGSGFGATQGTSTISMRGGTPILVSWSDTQIVIKIPSTAVSGAITVNVSGVSSNADVNFTVPVPQVTSTSPTSGAAGTSVTINGSGFQQTQPGNSFVRFNNVSATSIVSWSDSQIVAIAPSGGTGPVSVSVNSYASNLDVVFTMPDPVITSVSPSSGPVSTLVTVNGSGFGATQGASTITFGGVAAASVSNWTDTQIKATVPLTARAGRVLVTVGAVGSNADVYFNIPTPQITSISPSSGAVGTQVTVNGSGFQSAGGTISFNGTNATVSSNNWSPTQIITTVPSGAATGYVRVTAANGDSSNMDQAFNLPNPMVSSVSPVDGPAGTTLVTVSGNGFGATQGTISFNGLNATSISSWTDTQIQATVPSNASSGPVKVTNGGVGSNTTVSFMVGAVTVAAVNPPGGPTGTQVTVTGAGFGTTQGTISFNGTNATTITSWNNTQIVANVPTGAATGAVKVVAGGVSSNTTVSFNVANVVVNNVSPASGPAGGQFQINGSGFGTTQGSSSLRFAASYAPTVVTWSDTQITATAPAVAQTGSIVVTVGGVASNSNVNFMVVSPVITSISPTSGPVTASVTINGTGFGTNTSGNGKVTFGGANASIGTWSNSQITATVPSGAITGPVAVNPSGLISNQNFYFTIPGPHITSLSPSSGVIGTQVTINGSGFQGTQISGSTLMFYNTQSGAPIVSWNDTQIVATVPSGANALSGPVTVTVNNVNSNQDVLFNLPNPQITSVSPTSGTIGATVQVNGSGFGGTQGTSALTFYPGVNATIGTWSDTQISATVPTGASAGSIKVTEGGVTSNTNINFTVPLPHVTSVSPTTAPIGSQVTVTGSGFLANRGSNYLAFGSLSGFVQTYTSWTDTQIVATVPSTATTGPILVSADGVVSNADVLFTLPNPLITGLSPSSGPAGTSMQVQVNGSGFGASQGSSTITFNGVSPNVVSWSDTQIVVTLPATVSSGQVKIVEGGVNSNLNINFTVPPPQVASLSPISGVVGTQVTINGSGFQASQGNNSKVTFNSGSAASIVSWSDTQIVAAVPAGTTTGPVSVFVNNISSNQNVEFTLPNPQITAISPSNGPVGTQVTINGSGFGATQGTSTLAFSANIQPLTTSISATATIVSWSDTQIVATVPLAAVTGPFDVVEGGVASNVNIDYTVPAPQIASLTPNIGGGGNPVTISGTGFRSSPGTFGKVLFGSLTATVTSWSDTQIQVIVPGSAVTNPVQVFANGEPSNYVNYTVPNLTVTSDSPGTGPVGTAVTITGTGFGASQGGSTLTFGGQAPASITSWANTQIVATVPVTFTSGTILVTVNGIKSNNTVLFTVPGPTITGAAPQGGLPGAQIRFNGSGFQANQRDSTVTFNGVVAPIVSWSDTTITATVPTGATTGPLQVTVNGISGQAPNLFEVPNPVISSISMSPVPASGHFTINGTGFGRFDSSAGFVDVNGSNNMGVVSWSDTQIVAQASPFAQSGNLTVVKYGATSNAVPITVEGAPTVTSVVPPVAEVGSTVTVNGSGFGPQQGSSTVVFSGGVTGTVVSWSDTQIQVQVPRFSESGGVGVVWDNVGGGPAEVARLIVTKTTTVTDSLGNVSKYTNLMYFGTWLALSSTGSGCSSCTVPGNVSNTFDLTNGDANAGTWTSSTDELGHVTSYGYDAAMNTTSVTQYLDANTPVTTSYTYNSFGEPLTVTDPLGNVTTNTYDANGNLLTVTAPKPDANTLASVTHFTYDTKGELTQITDPLNNVTKLTYNPVGLIATVTDAQNNVTTYGYDQHGNRTSIIDAANNQTNFAYDAGDRLTTITYPDQSTVSFGYDIRGRRTSVTDQNGKVTSYAYDDADRLTSVTDAANNVTQYGYDTENNLLSITDANQHTTSFAYDAFRRVTQTTFPSTLSESYLYDAAGNLVNKTDRNGHSILYVYDALNRLTHKGYPDSTGVDYAYDLAGKIKQVTDPTGTYAMAYDNMGRLIGTTTTYSFLPAVPFTNSYSYDANSNRKMLTLPDGSNDSYTYDTLNRLTAITDSKTGVFNFGYDALSRRTSLTRPNGVNTSYGYDSLSRLLSVLHQNGTNTLDGATYTYDPAGNRTAKTNKLNNITEQYTYDPLYQLTQVVQGATTTESYSYDPVGNRLSSAGMSYNYNSSNELASTSSATFTYDNNGNTVSKADSTGTRNYTWDFENRLSSVGMPSGTVAFKYDPFGRRIQKAFTQSSTTTVTNYVYDGVNSIEEVDSSGSELARYAQGAGIDEPLSELRSGANAFYEQDGLGSVTSLSSSTAALANTYTYDTFGNTAGSNSSFVNPYLYTGRDYDSETGLRYYRARYYDSLIGRFLAEDPMNFASGLDFYAYVHNDPTGLADPSGKIPFAAPIPWWLIAGGAGTGALGGIAVGAGEIAIPVGIVGTAAWGVGRGIAHIPIPGGGTVEDGWTQIFTTLFFQQASQSKSSARKRDKCEKERQDKCDVRHQEEEAFCLTEFANYPKLLSACTKRAFWRWSNCKRGLPDPGPLDPMDPTWSVE